MFKFLFARSTSDRRVYVIKKTLWYITEPTYSEDVELRRILRGKLDFTALDPQNLDTFKIFDSLTEDGTLEKAFQVVLKPYEPTFMHKAWNAYWMKKNNVNQFCIISSMRNSEIARVIADFFIICLGWVSDWRHLLQRTGSFSRHLPTTKEMMSEQKSAVS